MYEDVEVSLSPNQINKVMKGGSIQLTPSQLRGCKHVLTLHPLNAKKIHKAMRSNKGCRICLSPDEVEMSGGNIGRFFRNASRKVKKGARDLKNKVIDSDLYQNNIRPAARELVNQGVDRFVRPLAGKKYADKVDEAVDMVGRKTRAFGMEGGRVARRKRTPVLQDDMNTFLNMQHPAMNPPISKLPPIGWWYYGPGKPMGGSFRAL